MNYIKVIEEIFKGYQGPKFSVWLWDKKERSFGSGKSANFQLLIKDEITVQKLLSQGSIGFGESFMNGTLEVEGDIEEYLKLRHYFKKIKFSFFLALAKFLSQRNIPRNRQNQISYHYDIGNDFFNLILDKKTMSYSSGMYTKNENLSQAQHNKIEFICQWLDLPEHSSILDLGSGWGGFATYAAQKYQWLIAGVTLSDAQLKYCQNLIKINNLKKMITFIYQDMFKNLPDNLYDGAVMIESIEHAGKQNLIRFFVNMRRVLKYNAPFILQFTGRYIPKRVDKWTLKYVFPGGYLPTRDEVIQAAEYGKFRVLAFQDDTSDYISTMTEWINNLEHHQRQIEKMFDKRFFRLWYLWMHGAKVNFEINDMSLFRLKLKAT